VLDLVPGITDPASIAYRDEATLLAQRADPEAAYVQEIMPDKIRLNLEYAGRASVRSDLGLIWRTIRHLGR
jgi:lipopolysaccharide/colanic/teichoic acid biosynthesis glycosyltransferase